MSSIKTLQRAEYRVNELIEFFNDYIDFFNRSNLFVGPSLYFHKKTLDRLELNQDPAKAIEDEIFFDYLYAMLTAWGMHRMGPGSTKLTEMNILKESFRKQKNKIELLSNYEIDSISNNDILYVTSKIWELIENLEISVSKTKIVAGSKALHHLFPKLIPPIDREYTIRFFYNRTNMNQGDKKAFEEIYPYLIKIAKSCKDDIKRQIGNGSMATSKTKIIDNAVVGYVLKEIKKK